MKHQADELEKLVKKNKRDTGTKFISITSGKGGVGKSSISSNLAYIFSQIGLKVAIFDADIGLANLDIMFNVKIKKNILHVLKGENQVEDVLIKINENLTLIPGDSGDQILKYKDSLMFERFMSDAQILDNLDLMIIDTGAGISEQIQLFLEASDMIIVVTTPDPSAITDAYATIKISQKLNKNIGLITNQVQNSKEGLAIFEKINIVARNNIGPNIDLEYYGKLIYDDIVNKCIRNRKLFSQEYPKSKASSDLSLIVHKISQKLEQKVLNSKNIKGFGEFFKKLIKF